MNWSDEGFLISKTRYNENSLLTELFTKDKGKISGIIFGGTSKKIKIEDKIISDSCEALIGAIYLDKGFNFVEKTILTLWKNHIDKSVITEIDAKTKLQETTLKKFKKLPLYKLISNTGPRHKPIFKVGVKLPNTKYFIATGKSKKEAEQNAAIECLKNLNKS